jgi:hypothetical protein
MDRLRLDTERYAAGTLGAAAATVAAPRRAALGGFLRHLAHGERIAERVARRQARLDRGLAAHGAGFVRLRRRIRAQEAAHHAFGHALVGTLVARGVTDGAVVAVHERAFRRHALALVDAAEPVLRQFALAPTVIAADLDARLFAPGAA